jgi:uncharacterized protein YunC (DUF1805 family)
MENKLLSFSDFENLYESYGYINESEEKATDPLLFDPFAPSKDDSKIADVLIEPKAEATNEKSKVDDFKPLTKGEKSERVKALQKDLGMSDKEADGIFGPATEAKVKEFQKSNKLTVDGAVGVQTLRKLLEIAKKIKGTEKQDDEISKKYIVKNSVEAKKAGIDPALLKVYESVTVIKNGSQTMVICIPRKDAAAQIKAMEASALIKANFSFMKNAATSVGKAILYTATGAVSMTLDMVKSMISSVASASKFVADGVMYASGTSIQGLASIANWASVKGAAIYNKVSDKAQAIFTSFAQNAAKVLKGTVQGATAFMDGIKAGAKTAGYVLTGLAVNAFKSVSSVLSPAVKSIVQGAKDAADMVKKGMEWIGKNVKNGAADFAKTLKAGWDSTVKFTKGAYNSGKKMIADAGKAVASAYDEAAKATSDFFTSMYNTGKSVWESTCNSFEDSYFVFEDLSWDLELTSDDEGFANV